MSIVGPPRWEHYVLLPEQELKQFWAHHLGSDQRKVLAIVGKGFDPRTPLGVRLLTEAHGTTRIDVIGLDFREGRRSPSVAHKPQADVNWREVEALVRSRGSIQVRPVEFWSEQKRRISSQSARDLFGSLEEFVGYTDLVVDISAMPRSVYFPLIARLMHLIDLADGGVNPPNLHVIVAEDPDFDSGILEEGIDERADFMASFVGGFDKEGTSGPRVWLPMLSEQRKTQLERIYDQVRPDEICAVLPSPARNPRRADNIVIEYHNLLFDEWTLDPHKFLHVSEHNPFEVYRRLREATLRYGRVFELLGGCKVALSPLSSKLMSLGALLVAYELKGAGLGVAVAHIESQGYGVSGLATKTEMWGLWLAGDVDAV